MTTAPELADIAAAVRRRLPAGDYQVFLFGSRATGGSLPSSDWDVGVLGPLPLRGAVLEAIRDELEQLRTLHTFEVVDLMRVSPGFRERALAGARRLV